MKVGNKRWARLQAAILLPALFLAACGGGGGGGGDGGGGSPPPPANTAPTVPNTLAAKVLSHQRVDLTWAASTDDKSVALYRVSRGGVEIASGISGTSYSDQTLQAQTTYSYTVRACDADGACSAESASVSGTTTATIPTVTVTSVASTAEVYSGLGSMGANQAQPGVVYTGAALAFGPYVMAGLPNASAIELSGPMAAHMVLSVNGQRALPNATVSNGDVVSVMLDLAAFSQQLVQNTGTGMTFNSLYTPGLKIGTTTIILGTSPVGAGILTCSNPVEPPAAANTSCGLA